MRDMIKPFLLWVAVLFAGQAVAQELDSLELELNAEDTVSFVSAPAIVLLKNKNNIIPLKRLDTLNIESKLTRILN